MHGPVNYLSVNSLKASILKRARPPVASPARMAVGGSLIGQARGEARRRRVNEPASFFQPQSHCRAALRCSRSIRCLDALLSERVESRPWEVVGQNRVARGLTVPRAHGRSRSSALAGPSMIERQEPGGATAQNRAAAYICIKKLSVCSQPMQRYVISSNLGLRGSERISLIFLPHVVHGSSATRKFAQVGVGREIGCIVAPRIGGNTTQRT